MDEAFSWRFRGAKWPLGRRAMHFFVTDTQNCISGKGTSIPRIEFRLCNLNKGALTALTYGLAATARQRSGLAALLSHRCYDNHSPDIVNNGGQYERSRQSPNPAWQEQGLPVSFDPWMRPTRDTLRFNTSIGPLRRFVEPFRHRLARPLDSNAWYRLRLEVQ